MTESRRTMVSCLRCFLGSRVDMEMLTMELDVRIPPEQIDPDLSIEVYTMKNSYETLKAFDADPWTLVADTTGVLLPDGSGLIIPTNDFNPVKLTAGQKQSFYVTMKRSYIDHNVVALQKTGELQVNAGDFDLMVGVGFTEYKFPGDYDRTLDPQFAGVFHFRTFTDCVRAVETTAVEYSFLLKQEVTPLLVATVNRHVDDTMKDLMNTNSALKSYQKYFGLQQYEETKTSTSAFDGACPEDWNPCPAFYVTTRVSYSHRDNLEGGRLSYELFRLADSINSAVQNKLLVSEADIIYVGLKSVSADLDLSLFGIPEGRMMNDAEQTYFASTLTEFVQEKTQGSFIAVYQVDIVGQSPTTNVRRSLQAEIGTLRVEAKIIGAQSTFLTGESYRNQLERVFRDGRSQLLEKLATNMLYPNDMTLSGGTDYFDSVTDIGGRVFVDEVAESTVVQTEAAGSNAEAFLAVGIAVAGLALVALFLFLRRHMKRGAENKKDKENMKMIRMERERADRETLREVVLQGKESSETSSTNEDSPASQEQRKIEGERSTPDLPKNLNCIEEEEQVCEELSRCDGNFEGNGLSCLDLDNRKPGTGGGESSNSGHPPRNNVEESRSPGGVGISKEIAGSMEIKRDCGADASTTTSAQAPFAPVAQSQNSSTRQRGMTDGPANRARVKSKSFNGYTTTKKPGHLGVFVAENADKANRASVSLMSVQSTSTGSIHPEAEDVRHSSRKKVPSSTSSVPVPLFGYSIGNYSGMTGRPADNRTRTRSKSFDGHTTAKTPANLDLFMTEHTDKVNRPRGSAMSVQPTPSRSIDPNIKQKRHYEAEDFGRSSPKKVPSRTPSAPVPQVGNNIGNYSGRTGTPAKNRKPVKSMSFDENTTTKKPGLLGLCIAESDIPRGSALSVQPISTRSVDPKSKHKRHHEAEDLGHSSRKKVPSTHVPPVSNSPGLTSRPFDNSRTFEKSKSFDGINTTTKKSELFMSDHADKANRSSGSAMSVQPPSRRATDPSQKQPHGTKEINQSPARRLSPRQRGQDNNPKALAASNRKTLCGPASFDENKSTTNKKVPNQANGRRRSKSFNETEPVNGANSPPKGAANTRRVYLSTNTIEQARAATNKQVPESASSLQNGGNRAVISSPNGSKSVPPNRRPPTRTHSAPIPQNGRARTSVNQTNVRSALDQGNEASRTALSPYSHKGRHGTGQKGQTKSRRDPSRIEQL